MSTGAGSVPLREENSNKSGSVGGGTKATMLKGPAAGKTGQRNGGMDGTFKGKRGR